MNRPSHWILASLVVIGGALWATGELDRMLHEQPSGFGVRTPGPERVVVRRNTPMPAAINSVLTGRAVDRLGWPVPGAAVCVIGESGASVLTDADGRFELSVPGAVQRRLRIEARNRFDPVEVAGSHEPLLVVMHDPTPWEEDVGLPGTGSLLVGEGWLKDAEGRRVVGGRVAVRQSGATARADDIGRFVVPLPDGDCTLVAWDRDGRVAVFDALPSARKEGKVPLGEFKLQPGSSVRGRVVDGNGQGLVGVGIRVVNVGVTRVVTTTEGGAFSVDGLIDGETGLVVLPHRGLLGDRSTIEVERATDRGEIVLHRPLQEPLNLKVLDAEDTPQAFVHVVAEQALGLVRAYSQADVQGRVALTGLGPNPSSFEVRSEDLQPLEVIDFQTDRGALIVAR